MNVQMLKYSKGRETVKDGDVVFLANRNTLVGTIIKFFTKSIYSHCGVAFWIMVGGVKRLMIVESDAGTKRRILNLSYYKHAELHFITAPIKWEEINHIALETIGYVKYNLFEACYVGLREFLFKTIRLRLPKKDFSGEICSEFVARLYNLKNQNISPQGVFEQLTEKGYSVRLILTPNE